MRGIVLHLAQNNKQHAAVNTERLRVQVWRAR